VDLADIIEVIEALKKLPEKLDKNGGFEKRIILKGEK